MTTGQQLRDQGISDVMAADEAIHRDCGRFIREAIMSLADTGNTFTADDVRAMLPEGMEGHSANLIPAHFGAQASAGRIEAVGMCKTSRTSRRASRNLIWRGVSA